MKIINIVFGITILSSLNSCNTENKEEIKREYSNITFLNTKISIGKVPLGTTKEIEFYAINKSDIPLVIDTVKSRCTCTVSKFPKRPILKNDSGLIVAKYTPNKSNIGMIEKSIIVLSNTKPAFTVLSFTGTVVE